MKEDQKIIEEASETLAEKLVETDEYEKLNKLEKEVEADSEAKELLEAYQEKNEMLEMMGGLDLAGDDGLEKLEKELNNNEKISAYFKAEEKWVELLQELFAEVSNQLEFNYLGSIGGGCC